MVTHRSLAAGGYLTLLDQANSVKIVIILCHLNKNILLLDDRVFSRILRDFCVKASIIFVEKEKKKILSVKLNES